MSVRDIPDAATSRYMYRFEIISAEKSFTGVANSPEHKLEWLQLLVTAIKAVQKNMDQTSLSQSKPVAAHLQPDYEAKSCTLCNERFTVTFRRHHCRQCGRIVCQPCSKYKRELAYKPKLARVCCVCVNKPSDWRPEGRPPGVIDDPEDDYEEYNDITSTTFNNLKLTTLQKTLIVPDLTSPKTTTDLLQKSIELLRKNFNTTPLPLSEKNHNITTNFNDTQENPDPPPKRSLSDLSQKQSITHTEQNATQEANLIEHEIVLEHRIASYLLNKYPESIDAWLEVINKISIGKLDPSKFPKSKNHIQT